MYSSASRRHSIRHRTRSTQCPPIFGSVSTLTTGTTVPTALNDEEYVDFSEGGGFGDDMEEEGNGGEKEEEEEVILPPLPPLGSVFDCAYVIIKLHWAGNERGAQVIRREAFNKGASSCYAKGQKQCWCLQGGTIPDKYLERYEALSFRLSQRSDARKRSPKRSTIL